MITGKERKVSAGYRKLLESMTGLSDPIDIQHINRSSGIRIPASYFSLEVIKSGKHQDKLDNKKSSNLSSSQMNKIMFWKFCMPVSAPEILKSILLCYRFYEDFQQRKLSNRVTKLLPFTHITPSFMTL